MMREGRIATTAFRLRASLLCLVLIGLIGAAVALAYERHWGSYWQLVPWATLGVIFVGLVALALFPSAATRKLAHLIAAATIIASCLGLWQHFDENYRTAPLDANYTGRWEDMSIVERVWEVTKGSVGHVPIYAAAALVPIAVALAMATIGVGQRDRPDEYVDPGSGVGEILKSPLPHRASINEERTL